MCIPYMLDPFVYFVLQLKLYAMQREKRYTNLLAAEFASLRPSVRQQHNSGTHVTPDIELDLAVIIPHTEHIGRKDYVSPFRESSSLAEAVMKH